MMLHGGKKLKQGLLGQRVIQLAIDNVSTSQTVGQHVASHYREILGYARLSISTLIRRTEGSALVFKFFGIHIASGFTKEFHVSGITIHLSAIRSHQGLAT